jgi:hypothetical protein
MWTNGELEREAIFKLSYQLIGPGDNLTLGFRHEKKGKSNTGSDLICLAG